MESLNTNFSKVLLMTANLGSIFEEPDRMLVVWFSEFLNTISRLTPDFIGLHCQEVGGKNYEDTMKHVDKFTRMLLQNDYMSQYKRAYVFLDEDFTAVEKFTALGSLYFIHNSVKDVDIYNFAEKTFVPAEGKEVFTGNIEHVPIKEKSKFPKDFFPDGVWSRKGFIRTRWRLYDTVFDLVNLHLFHDASNIVAMEKSPSLYSSHREQALLHTIKRFENDDHPKVPYFIFGDYNFRLDTHKLIKNLTADKDEVKEFKKNSDSIISSVSYNAKDTNITILKVGKKDFKLSEGDDLFSNPEKFSYLKQFDAEPDACKLKLYEYSVTFQPSYPFSENADECMSYMKTRCPGWCDRIMMSHSCRNIILNETEVEYAMIGKEVCMGDHKPIILNLKLHKGRTRPGTKMEKNDIAPNIQHALRNDRFLVDSVQNDFCYNVHDQSDRDTDLKNDLDDEEDRKIGVWMNKKPEVNVIDGGSDSDKLKVEKGKLDDNLVLINGEAFNLKDKSLNIHKNIQFEFEDLVTEKFMKSINRTPPKKKTNALVTSHSSEPLTNPQQQTPATAPAVTSHATGEIVVDKFHLHSPHQPPPHPPLPRPSSSNHNSPRLKHTRSFKEVINSVLKSDSILKYMKRFKHRSDSESEEEEEEGMNNNNNNNNNNNDNDCTIKDHHSDKCSNKKCLNRKCKSLNVCPKSISSAVDREAATEASKSDNNNKNNKNNDGGIDLSADVNSEDVRSDKNRNKLKVEERTDKRKGCKLQ